MDFNDFILSIQDLTDNNHHNEALLLVAEFYSLGKYVKILNGIITICNAEHHTPHHVSLYRHNIYTEIMQFIKDHANAAQYQAVYMAM